MQTSKKDTLPIFTKESEIITSVQKNIITIISGDTGCGKTTQVPQMLLKSLKPLKGLIGITQPRRISAISVAERVAEEMNVQIGNLVGYDVRFEERLSEKTKIKFMTEGILLKEFISDRSLSRYSVLIVDEAHERGLNSDIILGLLKIVSGRKKKLKIVIMSATLETDKFLRFFKGEGIGVSLIEVEGRFFPIEIYNLEQPVQDYVEAALNVVLQVNFNEENGDILVFLTGREEIENLKVELLKKIEKFPREFMKNPVEIIPLYSALPTEDQKKVFKTFGKKRKIIICTNIAETALTINGVKYVIDSGFVKIKNFDSKRNFESLIICPISKSSGIQRAGRAGRNQSGKCYRLYKKKDFENLEEFNIPEILRSNLILVTLHLKALYIEDLSKFPLIDKPAKNEFKKCMDILIKLGAVLEDGKITKFGKLVLEFPLDPFASFCLLNIYKEEENVQNDVLSVIALLNTDNIILKRQIMDRGFEKDFIKRFLVKDSDHLTKLKILYSYVDSKNKKAFCKTYFLRKKSLDTCLLIRNQLEMIFKKIGSRMGFSYRKGENPYHSIKNITMKEIFDNIKINFNFKKKRILKILETSFFQNIAVMNKHGVYKILNNGTKAKIHPESVVFLNREKPKRVIFNSIIQTTNIYLSNVSGLD